MTAAEVTRGFHSVSPIGSATSIVLPVALSDEELLVATRRLVGRSNQLLALLLGHLAEVEARGLHRIRACSSLYAYCIYELRFSEDEACRRVAAARLVRRFPVLLDVVAAGELHLTGLLMLGPHLTSENLSEVLARSKHRTKKEIARLVRQLDPLPDVPARIEPLGPAPARTIPMTPTFSQFVESLCPVRELRAGDRPRDWIGDGAKQAGHVEQVEQAGQVEQVEQAEQAEQVEQVEQVEHWREGSNDIGVPDVHDAAPAWLEPQRYRVQFTAGEEYVKLVEAAQALLSHSAERIGLDELQLRAMRALVAELQKRKHAAKKRPTSATAANVSATALPVSAATGATVSATALPGNSERAARSPRLIPESRAQPVRAGSSEPPGSTVCEIGNCGSFRKARLRQRSRHVPAAVRCAVFERDQGRCAYIDGSGRRCRETRRLELHHVKAFALGGEHTLENLALRCRAHNALAAEQDFGAEFIQRTRDSVRHESRRHQSTR
ncbi:MAG TPA: HNH endonuclease signature motif containing protein [Polyangiaceae bacterium]|nr:HNH endonuclease signature motif containing protein [Polyangiaceae bacterium]